MNEVKVKNSYKVHQYQNYAEYLTNQIEHVKTMYRTAKKSYDVYYNRMMEDFKEHDIKKILCVGARDASEVNFFRDKGIDALGVDLFSIDQSVIKILDMHNIANEFEEDEFDVIFACHSLEHSVDPDTVLNGMRKISKYGAFIVLPLHEHPHKKDPIVFNFMEKAGDEGEVEISIEDVQADFSSIVSDCEVKNLTQLPMFPDKDDGFWISVMWRK